MGGVPRRRMAPLPAPCSQAHRRVLGTQTITPEFPCRCTCTHKDASLVQRDEGTNMLARGVTAISRERPYNNLLRRLSAADFALIAPHLTEEEVTAGDLLYSPGDDVQIVHFPCGPALATYL